MKGTLSEKGLGSAGADYLVRHCTLRQLQLLEAIVRLGSFTRAAEELFLTQPTVSMQIKKLSESIGTPLFHHVGRTVEPTDAGREVYAACRGILNGLANLETKLSDLKGLRRGRLRLGVITTATYVAPEILGAFCQRYTGIDVFLNVTNRDQLLERLSAQDDDLYVMGQHHDLGQEVQAVPFAPNPLVMIARSDHPLVGQPRIPMSRLAEEDLLLREPGSGVRDAVLKHFAAAGVEPRVRMQLGSSETIKHAILGGLGISALSLHSVRLESGGGRFAVLDVEGFPIRRRWHLVYSRSRELSLVARTFLDFAIASEPDIRAQLNEAMTALMRVSGVFLSAFDDFDVAKPEPAVAMGA
ncbi:LysR family transcriptional regulator [Thiorhodovibrio frisius]|uniref:Transcriptional regulator n=1 Tax=Thiorhodovibrio frisius TaxID=631362 RepID=H8YWP2_9GAMM|nr:LysR family transcriptional regulator [Thiorhodovibrio frisius]EIC22868.1 transcriptional regulator [Thiorhodovibrio frisius]WPL22874.1 HTH-type transcriptional activator CmpR [Thiorhodovibrio frisius]